MDLYNVRKKLSMGYPLTSIKLRVTYYSRVSTDHQEQISSLNNQNDHFEEMIMGNPNWEYIPGYIEEGISGTTDYKREKFMQMIDDAHDNKFDLIITKEISRFSRNTLDSIKYTRELLDCGVAVLFLNDNINTALPDSELRLTIMASMAQDEIRRLSERVKFGMRRSIKKGNILGNNMLYGYRKDKLTGKLIIIPEEAKVVERLYNYYVVDNYSVSNIARFFNKENIKTGLNNKWCVSTLTRMLKNPKYKGYYCGGKSEVIDYMHKKIKKIPKSDWVMYKDSNIPPIVSDRIWNLANNRLQRKSSRGMYQNRYPLSGKIFCGCDNYLYHRREQNGNVIWMCSNYLINGKEKCNMPKIKQDDVYHVLRLFFQKVGIDLNGGYDILKEYYIPNNYLDNITILEKIIKIVINKIIICKDENDIVIKIVYNVKIV